MAGIGFELRRVLRKDTLTSLVQAYAYAGVIGSGPWVFSIVGILLIGIFSASVVVPGLLVTQFQTSVTYLVAGSLILTGLVQLAFTRFVSDRLFEKRRDLILPNLHGLLLVVTLASGVLGTLALFVVLPDLGLAYRMLMLAGFALTCDVWVLTVLLSGMKRYKVIVALFGLAYAVIVVSSLLLRPWGLEGLLAGFVLGHYLLLAGMWVLVVQEFNPKGKLIAFDFAQRRMLYPSLVAVGFLYNFGIWADKFMFWYFTPTSQSIIGGLRASIIYDLPVFLAYLSIIPGMAVFLVRIETDFVEYYDKFYDAVRSGGSLEYIEAMRDEMVYSLQQGLGEIGKIQTLAVLVTFVAGPGLLDVLGISRLYLPLLHVQVIGAGLQVGLMAILNVFFYLDQRRIVLVLCLQFVLLNIVFTGFTLHAGAALYGYGFALSTLLTLCTGMYLLSRQLNRLEYETFMLQ
ncbi:exopolysaccharide Pel transporter PelG [Xylophilus ampelinus]|uniref:Putative membrane protein n=1 Tax=Xylophilus ampelinus TaxID=54067 RepID=A0A318SM68_9BURK|nr:exopolysaccharide Pel transporter PelG [Xylophilus ampelinus]MCS4510132.1 exopolysaccharide Pel transporter PelG [Xylophilus ampelinus]PYE78282.1 putative membrane protein [Xylophilus ampelinus]